MFSSMYYRLLDLELGGASVIWPWNLFMDRSEMNSDNLARVYPAVLKTPHLASPINGVGARGVISKRIQIEREGSFVSDLHPRTLTSPECV